MFPNVLAALRTALRRNGADWLIFWTLCLGYATWLLSTVSDLGYARDEGFYFQAADAYLDWFLILFDEPGKALQQSVVDRHFRVNHEHPGLIKSLFGLSRYFFYDQLGWFEEKGTSYRFVGIALSSLAVGTIYRWGAEAIGREAGLVAALGFAFIPRIFYHSHLDCFDMPVLAMWLFTTYAYWRALERPTWGRVLLTGVLYGLLLDTKHNSWLLPFALVAHWLLAHGGELWRSWSKRRLGIPPALFAMALIGPLVFYALWPWIWSNTIPRLAEYVKFHTAHVYYNMEFLGQTYFEPPFPRSYAWLMSLATVPFVLWVVAAVGVGEVARALWTERLSPWIAQWRAAGLAASLRDETCDPALARRHSTFVLWGLFILVSYAPWLSNSSPIFGGTKHWTIAYPFLCLFGGLGFVGIVRSACASLSRVRPASFGPRYFWLARAGLAALLLTGPFLMTAHSHPWALSTYLPLVGGAPGGATMGLNRSFWGYTTGAILKPINDAMRRKSERIFVHDTALQSWAMFEEDKRVKRGFKPQLDVAGSNIAIYHHEQHMARVEHQIWVDYGTVKPVHIGAFDGVPVVWLYARPEKAAPTK
jgi:4-amino-4-deoxy-L-arabinose transferase-like glycosyltransferase